MSHMSVNSYAAQIGAEWIDFTPQHGRVREQALAVAEGRHNVPAAAIVGVYGCGKSTLLFQVLTEVRKQGVFPVWEEASSFLDRLVPAGERISAQEFVQRVHLWIGGLRTDTEILTRYQNDLGKRQLSGVVEAVQQALSRSAGRAVLLLDEMEQAYPHFLQRIDTADRQPLRALVDSCGNSSLRLLMAYAPESFHALGDADRGRMLRLAVPGLSSTAIQRAFTVTRGQANFAWWAGRGRVRGVIKAVNEVVIPYSRGEFKGEWLSLADALDGLPAVFGVPAVLRSTVPSNRLPELLDLVPHLDPNENRNYIIDLSDKQAVAHALVDSLADLRRVAREDVEIVADELLYILDAVADSDNRCALSFDDFAAGVKLAAAHSVEAGRLEESLEGLEVGRAFYPIAKPAEAGLALPFPLVTLAGDIFPSPFTDPILPFGNGRIPSPGQIERVFDDLVQDDLVFAWKEKKCWILRDISALDRWLHTALAASNESDRWQVLLLDDRGKSTDLLTLAREAGRVDFRAVGPFHACFIKCLAIRARQSGHGDDMDNAASIVRSQDRQLGRKVEWHLARLTRVLEEVTPTSSQHWLAAVGAARGENINGVLSRLGEEGNGLLALLYLFEPCRQETRKILADLAEILTENGELRKLVRAAGATRRLEGAAVVVDELLPGRTGSGRQRWVDTAFGGRRELSTILGSFGSKENAAVLGKLLNPLAAGRIERLIRFHDHELPDLGPERQQLSALQGINGVLRRAKAVHKAMENLLAVRENMAGIVLGNVVAQAITAQASIAGFNRIAKRIEKVAEPWAKALALWVSAVFAERIWSGVERDEAGLKAWETVTEKAKAITTTIGQRNEELRKLGLTAAAEFLSRERGRLKTATDDPITMQTKLEDFQKTLDNLGELADVLRSMKEVMSERGIEITHLLQRFRPTAGHIQEDAEYFRHLVERIRPIDGKLPVPLDDDLQKYARSLVAFAEETHSGRLRVRLQQALAIPVVPKDIILDETDITVIEELWPKLSEEFCRSCRETIDADTTAGSDKIATWVREATNKQSLLNNLPSDDRFSTLDVITSRWATDVTARPTELEDLVAARGRVGNHLRNLALSVDAGVIQELVKTAENEVPNQTYIGLERAVQSFHQALDDRAAKLIEILGRGGSTPFPGDNCQSVLSQLDEAREKAERKRDLLYEEIRVSGSVAERLGGRATAIPSPLTLDEAERLRKAAGDDLEKLFAAAWQEMRSRFRDAGLVDAEPIAPANDAPPEERLSVFLSTKSWWEQVAERANALSSMGISLPDCVDNSVILDELNRAVEQGQSELKHLNERIDLMRARLGQLGCTSDGERVYPVPKLDLARAESDRLQHDVHDAVELLLSRASVDAVRVYKALTAADNAEADSYRPIHELRHLGLVRTIEDDL
jgi:hypothetical protein